MKTSRAMSGLLLTCACALLPTALAGQGPKPTPPGTVIAPGLTLVTTTATPGERPMVEAIIAKIKAKTASDPKLMDRVEQAVAEKKSDAARTLMANAAGVPTSEVMIGVRASRGGGDDAIDSDGGGMFQLASYHPESRRARFNPYIIAFTYKSISVCFGSDSACKAWLATK